LFVGRLSYYKGVKYLIETIKNVKVNLVIIGEGKEDSNLKTLVKELKIENRVFFLPAQERKKLINFYQAAKVFVLPSIYKSEAFGLVLLEAMACGTPVISTELGTGTSFVNKNEVSGLVVAPRELDVLSEAINRLISNEQLRIILGQQARQRVEENFLLSFMLLEHRKLYEHIL
jgi:rhamnosyl/mannosyltransferase